MSDLREYNQYESVVFWKTTEKWGGLSNMARGYPVCVNGTKIQSSETLYQAMRFTEHPEIQKEILSQSNPMYGKRISRKYHSLTRTSWEQERVAIMKWAVCVKLCQNWESFSALLLSTGEKPIVEYSEKDQFWGAKSIGNHTYAGMNVLGRILMLLRDKCEHRGQQAFKIIPPPNLPGFNIFGQPVKSVISIDKEEDQISLL
ncbi:MULTISPECIES: NADAR family protein [Enterobacterales]|uniref:NADAR family protein n=1 Tax=Enterobacterales TaxID=91347 RepID=UPI00191F85F6|nr:NADAR family protein [Pectobacterium carotovorum]MBL0907061.1 NADAR family protein [Pectobacterium carotovorum]